MVVVVVVVAVVVFEYISVSVFSALRYHCYVRARIELLNDDIICVCVFKN